MLSLLLLSPAFAQSLPGDGAQDPILDVDPAPIVVTVALSSLEAAPPKDPVPPVERMASDLHLGVVPGAETAIDLRLRLDVLTAGPVDLPLVGDTLAVRSATLDGQPVAVPSDGAGWRRLVADLSVGSHVVAVTGTVATPRPQLDLALLPAARSRVEVAGNWDLDIDQAVPDDSGAWLLPAASAVRLSWRPPLPPAPRPQVVLAQASTALRVDASGIEARSRIQLTVLHQPTQTVALRLPPVSDLEITGPAVTGFARRGDMVDVQLSRPLSGRIDVELSYRAPPPPQDGAAAPLPVPETTSGRLDGGWVTVTAGDQGTVVPDPGRGLATVPSGQVPTWGKGLVPGGTVTSLALTGPRPELRLAVFDLTPAEAPGTFVDEARIEVAYAAHGRALLRCRYQVRNDRSQYLGVVLPQGAIPLGVRVAGTVVQPVTAGGRLFIPLEKSVETLSGLVTFPVELALLVPDAAWERRGERTLAAPAVDAPVAHARWEVVLPPGAQSRHIEGTPTVVDAWTSNELSLVIGKAGAVGSGTLAQEDAAEEAKERSQQAWNSAYRAYQDNEFDAARSMLEQSLAWDSGNDAAKALLGNVDVLLEESDEQEEGQARRIRSMARAKTQGREGEQSGLKTEAEKALRAGDYDKAYQVLDELETLTEQLAVVEDRENVDQKMMLQETRQQLAEAERFRGQKRQTEESAKRTAEQAAAAAQVGSKDLGSSTSQRLSRQSDSSAPAKADKKKANEGRDGDDGWTTITTDSTTRTTATTIVNGDSAAGPMRPPMAPAATPAPVQVQTIEEEVGEEGPDRFAQLEFDDDLIMGELVAPDGSYAVPEGSFAVVVDGRLGVDEAQVGDMITGWGDAPEEVTGGIEGGVVGGVLGGVSGATMGGASTNENLYKHSEEVDFESVDAGPANLQALGYLALDQQSAAAPPPPPPPPPIDAPATQTESAQGFSYLAEPAPQPQPEPEAKPRELSKEVLQSVPTGRSYQSSVQVAAGVSELTIEVRSHDSDGIYDSLAPEYDLMADVAADHDGPRFRDEHRVGRGAASNRRGPEAPADPFRMAGQANSHPVGPVVTHTPPLAPSLLHDPPMDHIVVDHHPVKPPPPPRDPLTVPTAEAMDPAVTAAPLSVRPPRAGERLLLEQRLLAPDVPMTMTLSYRFTDRSQNERD